MKLFLQLFMTHGIYILKGTYFVLHIHNSYS